MVLLKAAEEDVAPLVTQEAEPRPCISWERGADSWIPEARGHRFPGAGSKSST